jgi:hypothetical protein
LIGLANLPYDLLENPRHPATLSLRLSCRYGKGHVAAIGRTLRVRRYAITTIFPNGENKTAGLIG